MWRGRYQPGVLHPVFQRGLPLRSGVIQCGRMETNGGLTMSETHTSCEDAAGFGNLSSSGTDVGSNVC